MGRTTIAFLTLHAKQTGRLLRELGLIRSLVVLVLIGIALVSIYPLRSPYPYLVAGWLFFSFVSWHTFRQDRTFLKILGVPTYALYVVEYHILMSPVYLLFLLRQHWLAAVGLFAAVHIVPLINFRVGRSTTVARRLAFVPPVAFEWKSGLRRYGGMIGLLYLLALSLYTYPFAALLVMVVFTLITTTFYNPSESRAMVEAVADSPSAFLFKKGKNQLMLFWTGCTPLMLVFLLTNGEYWYVLLVLVVVSSVIQLLSISLKYSFYEPERTLDKRVFVAIYLLSLLVPFFVPVPLLMQFYYYRKARNNLKRYL